MCQRGRTALAHASRRAAQTSGTANPQPASTKATSSRAIGSRSSGASARQAEHHARLQRVVGVALRHGPDVHQQQPGVQRPHQAARDPAVDDVDLLLRPGPRVGPVALQVAAAVEHLAREDARDLRVRRRRGRASCGRSRPAPRPGRRPGPRRRTPPSSRAAPASAALRRALPCRRCSSAAAAWSARRARRWPGSRCPCRPCRLNSAMAAARMARQDALAARTGRARAGRPAGASGGWRCGSWGRASGMRERWTRRARAGSRRGPGEDRRSRESWSGS